MHQSISIRRNEAWLKRKVKVYIGKKVYKLHPEEESLDYFILIGCSATQSLSFLLQTSEDQAMHVMAAAIQLDLVTSSTHESTGKDRIQPDWTGPDPASLSD